MLPEQFITWAKLKKYKVPKAFEEFKHVDLLKDLEQAIEELSKYVSNKITFINKTRESLNGIKIINLSLKNKSIE